MDFLCFVVAYFDDVEVLGVDCIQNLCFFYYSMIYYNNAIILLHGYFSKKEYQQLIYAVSLYSQIVLINKGI